MDVESESLETHVALCGERYRTLELRILRLERITLWATAASLTGMASVIITLVVRLA
jgi:hypothetical protein